MNLSKKIFVLAMLIGLVFSNSDCSAARNSEFYNYIKKISEKITPLPLLYAKEKERRSEYDNVMNILFSLMYSGDTLVIMTPDGDYTPFVFQTKNKIIAQPVRHDALQKHFDDIFKEHGRVWVVVVDYRAGWQAQPPQQYLKTLQTKFMELPLPMPTFFADKNIVIGSTNYWHKKTELLEKVLKINKKNRNPRLYLRLGQVCRRFGKLDKAVSAYQNGIKNFPDDPFLHRELGECYYWEYSPPLLEESIKENRLANQYHISKFGKPKYDAMFNMAMAYRDLGELKKAQFQYNDILRAVNEFPNDYFESQTRRYLGNLYLETGDTNSAATQYKLDLNLSAQSPAYSYRKLIDIYFSDNQTNKYIETLNEYYNKCGKKEPDAIIRYIKHIKIGNDNNIISAEVKKAKIWMHANTNLYNKIKLNPEWWNIWTNAAIDSGISPAVKTK